MGSGTDLKPARIVRDMILVDGIIENTGVSTFLLLIFVPFFLFSIRVEGLCG